VSARVAGAKPGSRPWWAIRSASCLALAPIGRCRSRYRVSTPAT